MNAGNRLNCILAVLFLLAMGYSTQAEAQGRDYGEAVKAMQGKKWDRAEEKIRDALAKEDQAQASILISGSIRARYMPYYVLGAALAGQGDCDAAITAWRESISQGQVQNSKKEFADLQAGLGRCGSSLAEASAPPGAAPEPEPVAPAEPDISAELQRVADAAANSLNDLRQANSRYSALARNQDLAPQWPANWKPALDQSQRELQQLDAALEQARTNSDIAAIEGLSPRIAQATSTINQQRQAAERQIATLEQTRLASVNEDRARREAEAEQRRQLAQREQEEQDRRRRESENRERLAAAQRELRQELDSLSPPLAESTGNNQVIAARSQLAQLSTSGQALLTSNSADDIAGQAQSIRDGLRRYNQAKQEWEAAEVDKALRIPPPELETLAKAYFAGDYQRVSQMADPAKFTEDRHVIQTYLFRSAALFNLYYMTAGEQGDLLSRARNDINQIKGLKSDFVPYVAAFSPKFLEFFQES
jgi:hypothetical protein